MSVSCHCRWWSSWSCPGLKLHFNLDDIQKLEQGERQNTQPAEKAGACLQNSSNQKYTKSYQQHCFDWPRYSSNRTVRLPVNIKYVKITWMHKPKSTKIKLFSLDPFRAISLHVFSGWDNIKCFCTQEKAWHAKISAKGAQLPNEWFLSSDGPGSSYQLLQ